MIDATLIVKGDRQEALTLANNLGSTMKNCPEDFVFEVWHKDPTTPEYHRVLRLSNAPQSQDFSIITQLASPV